jgi:hypothetical protein
MKKIQYATTANVRAVDGMAHAPAELVRALVVYLNGDRCSQRRWDNLGDGARCAMMNSDLGRLVAKPCAKRDHRLRERLAVYNAYTATEPDIDIDRLNRWLPRIRRALRRPILRATRHQLWRAMEKVKLIPADNTSES